MCVNRALSPVILLVLQTLQSLLESLKRGQPIKEEEIPQPVATGCSRTVPQDLAPIIEEKLVRHPLLPTALTNENAQQGVDEPTFSDTPIQPELTHSGTLSNQIDSKFIYHVHRMQLSTYNEMLIMSYLSTVQ